MKTRNIIICASIIAFHQPCHAGTMDAPFIQTGAFYADGSLDNSPTFQNYFIGYGTTPGFPRTLERRHFFVFDLTGTTDPIISAELSLILPFGGLIGDEPTETWVATGTGVPAAIFLDTGLTPTEAGPVFDEMGAAPAVIDPVDFGPGDDDSLEKTFALNATGISFLNSHLGGLVAITGFMPSWSEEPVIAEGSELIFGFTDVVGSGPTIDPPVLSFTIIPEPTTPALLAIGLISLGFRKNRRKPLA